MTKDWETTRVVKRMAAWQNGALKLARRYGDALVCVRYRQDADGARRYTTIELMVDERPVERRASLNEIVAVKIGLREHALQERALKAGARWNDRQLLWYMPRHLARRLGFADRITRR